MGLLSGHLVCARGTLPSLRHRRHHPGCQVCSRICRSGSYRIFASISMIAVHSSLLRSGTFSTSTSCLPNKISSRYFSSPSFPSPYFPYSSSATHGCSYIHPMRSCRIRITLLVSTLPSWIDFRETISEPNFF